MQKYGIRIRLVNGNNSNLLLWLGSKQCCGSGWSWPGSGFSKNQIWIRMIIKTIRNKNYRKDKHTDMMNPLCCILFHGRREHIMMINKTVIKLFYESLWRHYLQIMEIQSNDEIEICSNFSRSDVRPSIVQYVAPTYFYEY